MASARGIEVGRVVDTSIYPFKGMRGVKMDEISLRSVSVVGDRTRAFTITDARQTPTLLDTTKFPGLLHYSPSLLTPEDPRTSEVLVRTPNGHTYSADSNALLKEISEKCGRELAILRMGRGAYHSMPVSLLSLASIRAIEKLVGFAVDSRRFRENILIETIKNNPYEEDEWIGKVITFGDREDSARIAAVKLDERCATVNMDPETGEQNPEILRSIVRSHDRKLGIYCGIVFEGRVLKEDTVYVSPLR